MASFLVICVHYGPSDHTVRFIETFRRQKARADCDVVIVDNSANFNLPPADLDDGLSVQIVRPERNLGYFGGASFAFDVYTSNKPIPEWVIVANPDTRPNGSDFVTQLGDMQLQGASAVLAPSILRDATGTDQNPHLETRPSRAAMHFYKFLYRSSPLLRLYERASDVKARLGPTSNVSVRSRPKTPRKIYAPAGAFLIFNQRYFSAGGSLRYPEFLFGEEMYVAETARALGIDVVYEPGLIVSHVNRASMGTLTRTDLDRHGARAMARIADEFFPWRTTKRG